MGTPAFGSERTGNTWVQGMLRFLVQMTPFKSGSSSVLTNSFLSFLEKYLHNDSVGFREGRWSLNFLKVLDLNPSG